MTIKELTKPNNRMSTATKISLVTMLISTAALPAAVFGVISTKSMSETIYAGLIIQLIIFAYVLTTHAIKKQSFKYQIDKSVKIARYAFCDRHIKKDTYILPEFVFPTNPNGECIFSIIIKTKDIKKSPVVDIQTDNGNLPDMKERILAVEHDIEKDLSLFHIAVMLTHKEKMNIKFLEDTNIDIFFLGELYIL